MPSLERFPSASIGPPTRGTCPCPPAAPARIPRARHASHAVPAGFSRASDRRETRRGAVPMLPAPQRRSPVARLSPGFVRRHQRTRRVRRLTLTKSYGAVLAPRTTFEPPRCAVAHRPLRRRASSPSRRGRDACRATTRHGVPRRYHTPGRFVTSRSRAVPPRNFAPRTASRPLSLISGFAKLVTGAVPAAARPHPPPHPEAPPFRRRNAVARASPRLRRTAAPSPLHPRSKDNQRNRHPASPHVGVLSARNTRSRSTAPTTAIA